MKRIRLSAVTGLVGLLSVACSGAPQEEAAPTSKVAPVIQQPEEHHEDTKNTDYCNGITTNYMVETDKDKNPVFKAEQKRDACSMIGKKAPAFYQLDSNPNSRSYGKYIGPQDFAGNVIALNYWAPWCGPCLAEMPEFEKVKQNLGYVTFLLLNADEGMHVDPGALFAFQKNVLPGLTLPVLDRKGKSAITYTMIEDQGTRNEERFRYYKGKPDNYSGHFIPKFLYGDTGVLPTTIIIDRNQIVREIHNSSLGEQQLTAIVERYK